MTSLWAAVIPVGCLCALSERESWAVPTIWTSMPSWSIENTVVQRRGNYPFQNIHLWSAEAEAKPVMSLQTNTEERNQLSLERVMWSVSDAWHMQYDTMGSAPRDPALDSQAMRLSSRRALTAKSEAFDVALSHNEQLAGLREKHCLIRTWIYRRTLHFPTK